MGPGSKGEGSGIIQCMERSLLWQESLREQQD